MTWGPWRLESRPARPRRSARAGRATVSRVVAKKVQDVFVDAKVPRDERDAWPLVVDAGDEVVAVPGLAVAPGWEGAVPAPERVRT